ncbi:hypothetical protein C8Q73DRAFT_89491 [Cubamyces lactineus]|nr:hypothetical protein C8Q73DRAFT_89491 [Cubamyces lactineus]
MAAFFSSCVISQPSILPLRLLATVAAVRQIGYRDQARPLILNRHISRRFDHFGISMAHAGKTPCHSNATYSDAEGVKLTDTTCRKSALCARTQQPTACCML